MAETLVATGRRINWLDKSSGDESFRVSNLAQTVRGVLCGQYAFWAWVLVDGDTCPQNWKREDVWTTAPEQDSPF